VALRDEAHVGTDRKGRVHHVNRNRGVGGRHHPSADAATRDEQVLYGDQAYWKEADRHAYEARGVATASNRRADRHHPLSERWRKINRAARARGLAGEHPFLW